MDRRDFIKQTGVAAIVATVGSTASGSTEAAASTVAQPSIATPSIASGARELRVATPWSQNGRGFDDSARRLAANLKTLSSGRITLAVLPDRNGLEALNSGDADVYHGSGRDFVSLEPGFAFFAGLPGKAALRPTYLNAWLTAGGGQALWDGMSATHGFKPFFAGHSGSRAKLWSRVPITSSADLKGLRIAAHGLSGSVVERLGATPINAAVADLSAGLANHSTDAVEWGATVAGFACDLHQSARFCYAPGLSRSGFTSVLAIRTHIWNAMSHEDQAIVRAAISHELNEVVAESLNVSKQLRLSLAERHGISFSSMSADVTAASLTVAAQTVAELAATNAQTGLISASYMAFRDRLPRHKRQPVPLA